MADMELAFEQLNERWADAVIRLDERRVVIDELEVRNADLLARLGVVEKERDDDRALVVRLKNQLGDRRRELDEARRAVLYQDDVLSGESGGWTNEQYEARWEVIDRAVMAASKNQRTGVHHGVE